MTSQLRSTRRTAARARAHRLQHCSPRRRHRHRSRPRHRRRRSGRGIPDAQVIVAGTRIGAITGRRRRIHARRRSRRAARRSPSAGSATSRPRRPVTVVAGGTCDGRRRAERQRGQPERGRRHRHRRRRPRSASRHQHRDRRLDAHQPRAGASPSIRRCRERFAGAQITQNSGGPGGGGISVRLRGTNSFISGSDPLYIVDGVIVDNGSAQLADLGVRSNPQNRLADLNPADIERIEIIRGAAAAALYGSRANNGVVQIFTKRGSIGRPRFTLNVALLDERAARAAAVQLLSVRRGRSADRSLQLSGRHLPTRAGGTEQNLTVEGGNDQTRYFISGNFANEDGILRSTSSRRTGGARQPPAAARVAAHRQRHGELHHHEQPAAGVRRAERLRHHGLALLRADAGRLPPGERHLSAAAGARHEPAARDRPHSQPADDRPLHRLRQADVDAAISDLLLDYTIGIDNAGFEQRQFVPRERGARHGAARDRALAVGVPGHARRQPGRRRELHLGADRRTSSCAPPAAFNYTSQRVRTTQRRRERPRAGRRARQRRLGLLRRRRPTSSSARSASMDSRKWRGSDRLFLTGAVRYDASSTFAPSERWQAFPKFSASYVVVDNQPGHAQQPARCAARSDGRAASRASSTRTRSTSRYAQAAVRRASRVRRTTSTSAIPTCATSARASGRSAPTSAFSNGRVGAEATYYDRLVSDLLFFRPLPTSTGFSRQFFADRHDVEQGIRAAAAARRNVDMPNLTWSSTVTYTHNKNLVESLAIQDFQSAGGYPNRIRAG